MRELVDVHVVKESWWRRSRSAAKVLLWHGNVAPCISPIIVIDNMHGHRECGHQITICEAGMEGAHDETFVRSRRRDDSNFFDTTDTVRNYFYNCLPEECQLWNALDCDAIRRIQWRDWRTMLVEPSARRRVCFKEAVDHPIVTTIKDVDVHLRILTSNIVFENSKRKESSTTAPHFPLYVFTLAWIIVVSIDFFFSTVAR